MKLSTLARAMVLATFVCVDLFCGAGGFTEGFEQAADQMGVQTELTLVNHWMKAMRTQAINHPKARLICSPIEDVCPNEAVPGRVDMVVAAPECTHFSRAAGGAPKNDQSRSKAHWVLEWVAKKLPTYVVVENVPEFMTWGPIDANGKVIKSRKAETFNEWVAALEKLGYRIRYEVLNAADYGVPQTRKRFILIAKRESVAVPYPVPMWAKKPAEGSAVAPWDIAFNHIDWTIKSQSIYTRKKPLAIKTLKRIEIGLQRFGGPLGDPFLVVLRNHMAAQSLMEPFSTVTAGGLHFGLLEPKPVPFLTKFHGGEGARSERVQSLDEPFLTLDTQNRFGLAQPELIPVDGHQMQGMLTERVEEPQAMLVPHRKFNIDDCDSIFKPFRTLDATNCRQYGMAQPRLVQIGDKLFFPDLHFRMLVARELANAQSFPKHYGFEGTLEDQTKQIGNAIPVKLAKAIGLCILEDWQQDQGLVAA